MTAAVPDGWVAPAWVKVFDKRQLQYLVAVQDGRNKDLRNVITRLRAECEKQPPNGQFAGPDLSTPAPALGGVPDTPPASGADSPSTLHKPAPEEAA